MADGLEDCMAWLGHGPVQGDGGDRGVGSGAMARRACAERCGV